MYSDDQVDQFDERKIANINQKLETLQATDVLFMEKWDKNDYVMQRAYAAAGVLSAKVTLTVPQRNTLDAIIIDYINLHTDQKNDAEEDGEDFEHTTAADIANQQGRADIVNQFAARGMGQRQVIEDADDADDEDDQFLREEKQTVVHRVARVANNLLTTVAGKLGQPVDSIYPTELPATDPTARMKEALETKDPAMVVEVLNGYLEDVGRYRDSKADLSEEIAAALAMETIPEIDEGMQAVFNVLQGIKADTFIPLLLEDDEKPEDLKDEWLGRLLLKAQLYFEAQLRAEQGKARTINGVGTTVHDNSLLDLADDDDESADTDKSALSVEDKTPDPSSDQALAMKELQGLIHDVFAFEASTEDILTRILELKKLKSDEVEKHLAPKRAEGYAKEDLSKDDITVDHDDRPFLDYLNDKHYGENEASFQIAHSIAGVLYLHDQKPGAGLKNKFDVLYMLTWPEAKNHAAAYAAAGMLVLLSEYMSENEKAALETHLLTYVGQIGEVPDAYTANWIARDNKRDDIRNKLCDLGLVEAPAPAVSTDRLAAEEAYGHLKTMMTLRAAGASENDETLTACEAKVLNHMMLVDNQREDGLNPLTILDIILEQDNMAAKDYLKENYDDYDRRQELMPVTHAVPDPYAAAIPPTMNGHVGGPWDSDDEDNVSAAFLSPAEPARRPPRTPPRTVDLPGQKKRFGWQETHAPAARPVSNTQKNRPAFYDAPDEEHQAELDAWLSGKNGLEALMAAQAANGDGHAGDSEDETQAVAQEVPTEKEPVTKRSLILAGLLNVRNRLVDKFDEVKGTVRDGLKTNKEKGRDLDDEEIHDDLQDGLPQDHKNAKTVAGATVLERLRQVGVPDAEQQNYTLFRGEGEVSEDEVDTDEDDDSHRAELEAEKATRERTQSPQPFVLPEPVNRLTEDDDNASEENPFDEESVSKEPEWLAEKAAPADTDGQLLALTYGNGTNGVSHTATVSAEDPFGEVFGDEESSTTTTAEQLAKDEFDKILRV